MDSLPAYIQERVCRVVVDYEASKPFSVGSGFFVDQNTFLTAAHVVVGKNAPAFFNEKTEQKDYEIKNQEALKYFYSLKSHITIELPNGGKIEGKFENMDFAHDIAVIRVNNKDMHVPLCVIARDHQLKLGDVVFYGGFSDQFGYEPKKWPYTHHQGIIASLPEIMIVGGTYQHIRVHAINLAGNSGAPLFEANNGRVIGMVNGNMQWGNDTLASIKQILPNGSFDLEKTSLQVPLPICYATSMDIITKRSTVRLPEIT
jgi:S1-C subfamily serine protease